MIMEDRWFKIPPTAVKNKLPQKVEVGEREICLVYKEDKYHAMSNICPHASVPMHQGSLNKDGDIVCVKHRYSFNINTGRPTDGSGFYLKCFDTEEREDGWYINIPKPNF